LTLERSHWEGGENEAVGHHPPVCSAQRRFLAGENQFGGEKSQANKAKKTLPRRVSRIRGTTQRKRRLRNADELR
jgi:hypothetical protein